MDESVDLAAARELQEETGVRNLPIIQFGTFGEVDRDPRMRVISVAYMAFVSACSLDITAGDDAADAELFEIDRSEDGRISFSNDKAALTEEDLAFDHAEVIRTALERLSGRIEYTEDAFALLEDQKSFTIHELKSVYEAVLFRKLDTPNFRREFVRKYVNTGKAKETGKTSSRYSSRAAKLYRYIK